MIRTTLKSATARALLALAAAAISGTANAGACIQDTMANYVALGAAGCTSGDMTFSHFIYGPNPLPAAIPAANVTVTPVTTAGGEVGFIFQAPWKAPATADVLINFTVAETNPATVP